MAKGIARDVAAEAAAEIQGLAAAFGVGADDGMQGAGEFAGVIGLDVAVAGAAGALGGVAFLVLEAEAGDPAS